MYFRAITYFISVNYPPDSHKTEIFQCILLYVEYNLLIVTGYSANAVINLLIFPAVVFREKYSTQKNLIANLL